ncbi:acyltransferase family protein [Hephaestia mangrovi]|uniref:acyltransferase family protein n=1 Tax=Hephaestia mangrovi TaxID=2873268 RepID=UPI001CA79BAA|nr:acyltransferase [Hephaestia mangrovi]MBY8829593.1 acyltransferase [Hephaestia mangrovi]
MPAAEPRAPAPPPNRRQSAAIGIARVVCILGIVYVHAWTGMSGDKLRAMADSWQGVLRWAVAELFGLSAVPLLSVISGWLVAPSLVRRGLGDFYASKTRTILLPMLIWNALALLFVALPGWLGWLAAPAPSSWVWTLNELTAIARPNEIDVQMPFLRDLFVCMLAAPALVRLPGWALGLVIALSLAWSITGLQLYVLLRPAILVFFVVGILARRHDWARRVAERPLWLTGLGYAVFAGIEIWLQIGGASVDRPHLLATLDLAMRLATAMFFWSLVWRLAVTRAGAILLKLEPYAFLLFCAQLIVIWLGGPAVGRLTGPLGAPLYPLFLLLQPVLVLAAVLAIGRLLAALSPAVAALLSGGRLSAERIAADRARNAG